MVLPLDRCRSTAALAQMLDRITPLNATENCTAVAGLLACDRLGDIVSPLDARL